MKTELDKKCDADEAVNFIQSVAKDCDKCKIGEFYHAVGYITPLEYIQETAELAGEGGWAERQERMEREEDNE